LGAMTDICSIHVWALAKVIRPRKRMGNMLTLESRGILVEKEIVLFEFGIVVVVSTCESRVMILRVGVMGWSAK
jgi:hypothetical protein